MTLALDYPIESSMRNGEKIAEMTSTRELAFRVFSVDAIQQLNGDDLLTLRRVLRHGDNPEIWISPYEWFAPGTPSTLSSIDLRKRIVAKLPAELNYRSGGYGNENIRDLVEHAVVSLTRYLLLLRMGPAGLGSLGSRRPLDVSTIANIAYSTGPSMMALAIEKMTRERIKSCGIVGDIDYNKYFLNHVERGDLDSLTKGSRARVLSECKRMQMLFDMNLWWDVPCLAVASTAEAMTGPARVNERPEDPDSHSPLPDEYVAEMGRKSLWITNNLAPNLLAITERIAELWERTALLPMAVSIIEDRRRKGVKKLLAEHQWTEDSGCLFDAPPFHLGLPALVMPPVARAKHTDEAESLWPPKNYRDVLGLLAVVQMAHYFIVALSMGARRSEALGLRRDCLVNALDGRQYANGRTYKVVRQLAGAYREWLLPDVATAAIERQAQLVAAVDLIARVTPTRNPVADHKASSNLEKPHLWAQLSAAGSSDAAKPLGEINKQLRSFAQRLQMDVAPGGQNFRSHRFRKTLARLVALALTQAPKVLMDVFGHKTIEMTLYYILTDKDLAGEIETVSRELRVMRATEVVEKMVESDFASEGAGAQLGGYGGLAAISLHSAVEIHRQNVHRRGADWNAESAIELAELLTLQGKAWEQVRTGVICTKFPGEAGPCNKRRGRPEPSKCQSSCAHRLEEAFLREDVDGAIEAAVAGYEHAIANDEALTAAHWAGQVRANVPRFPDVRAKWSTNETVRTLMAKQSQRNTLE